MGQGKRRRGTHPAPFFFVPAAARPAAVPARPARISSARQNFPRGGKNCPAISSQATAAAIGFRKPLRQKRGYRALKQSPAQGLRCLPAGQKAP